MRATSSFLSAGAPSVAILAPVAILAQAVRGNSIPMMQKVSYQVVSYYGGAGRGEKVGENMRK